MANNEDKKKALEAAIAKLEKDFGKGTVMRLGDPKAQVAVETVPTGAWISHWDLEACRREGLWRSTGRSPAVRRRWRCT